MVVLNKQGGQTLKNMIEGDTNPVSALMATYGISEEQAQRDVKRFEIGLCAQGVITSIESRRSMKEQLLRRRKFVVGATVLGASLLSPPIAFGEESAAAAKKAYSGDELGGWLFQDKDTRIWVDSTGCDVSIPSAIETYAPYGPYAQAVFY